MLYLYIYVLYACGSCVRRLLCFSVCPSREITRKHPKGSSRMSWLVFGHNARIPTLTVIAFQTHIRKRMTASHMWGQGSIYKFEEKASEVALQRGVVVARRTAFQSLRELLSLSGCRERHSRISMKSHSFSEDLSPPVQSPNPQSNPNPYPNPTNRWEGSIFPRHATICSQCGR